MNKQQIKERIFELVFDHAHSGDTFYVKSGKFTSLQGEYDPMGQYCDAKLIKGLIDCLVEKAIRDQGLVYLYVCRDNEIVAFEDVKNLSQKNLELYNDQELPGLFIGWD